MQVSKPKLSVVIASCVGAPYIDRCLKSLEKQIATDDIECILIDRAGADLADRIESEYRWLKVFRRPPGESVPDLRRYGISQAQANFVAIIEEHCVAQEDWIETIMKSIEGNPAAIGGIVADADYERLTDWAVYFTEYNSYMPPGISGETNDVCVANCVYRRDLLLKYLPTTGSGYWEASLNKTLLDSGERFLTEPRLVVSRTVPSGLSYYLHQRYLFSRAFAGVRRDRVSLLFKLFYVFLAPILMPLLWARIASRVLASKRNVGKFVAITPLMVPIMATYVFGECVGFLLGPGDSLKKIE